MDDISTGDLFEALSGKGSLKQRIYKNTLSAFHTLCAKAGQIAEAWAGPHPIEYTRNGDFQAEMRFAGDALVFMMHTNVFEFSRDHEVMRTAYVREDKERSYCGIIHIYNFLADSFRYNRDNDLGYLIGRVFINKDMHYFIEGKREVGVLYPNFGNAVYDENAAHGLVKSAMLYAINFDLLTPPFDEVKMLAAGAVRNYAESTRMITAKRLGFRFQADQE
jgi:hypothetical protein